MVLLVLGIISIIGMSGKKITSKTNITINLKQEILNYQHVNSNLYDIIPKSKDIWIFRNS